MQKPCERLMTRGTDGTRLMLVLLTMWSRNALTSVSVVFTATCHAGILVSIYAYW